MFSVQWSPAALDELTRIWLDSRSEQRDLVTRTVARIDDTLRRSAATAGESRDPDFRVLLVAPLGIEFEVRKDDQLAIIARVWHYTPRR
jgi:hypothetical protein